jgi:hypothetical protein
LRVQCQKKKTTPNGVVFLFLRLAQQALTDLRVMSPASVARWGSEGSAACGRYSDPSEWPGSARDAGALSPRTFAGHPNRGDTQNQILDMFVTKIKSSLSILRRQWRSQGRRASGWGR